MTTVGRFVAKTAFLTVEKRGGDGSRALFTASVGSPPKIGMAMLERSEVADGMIPATGSEMTEAEASG